MDCVKQVDTGGLSFAELREEDMYYVDKSLLIKDILEGGRRGVYLFTRPRRFGKTTNLSMLDAFFNIQYKGNTWFDGLEISKHPEFERYKNAFPVIHLDLNDTKAPDYDSFIDMMRTAVSNVYEAHEYLLREPDVDPDFVELFRSVKRRDLKESFLVTSIGIYRRRSSNLSEGSRLYSSTNTIALFQTISEMNRTEGFSISLGDSFVRRSRPTPIGGWHT